MANWQSQPIQIDGGATIDVKADVNGVTLGAQSDDSILVDLNLTPTQARAIASALNQGADVTDAARGEA